jgi:hypothetical protein
VAGFRNGPYDVSVKITNDYGQVLCSNDHTKQVALLSQAEAEETGRAPSPPSWTCCAPTPGTLPTATLGGANGCPIWNSSNLLLA